MEQRLIEEALTASARLSWQGGGPAQLAALHGEQKAHAE